jgi:hypothetical protein
MRATSRNTEYFPLGETFMSGAKDKIVFHDTAGAALGCAKCGAVVQSGQTHTCKGEVLENGDKQNAEVTKEGDSAA